MKKKIFLLLSLLLISCSGVNSSSLSSSLFYSSEINQSSYISESFSFSSSTNIFSSSNNSSSSSKSNSSSSEIVSRIPENKNNKVILGSSNASMSSFEFANSTLPDYFRAIYGYNFVKGDFYADGTLKISSDNDAKQGFQTAMFVSNKKLEIRLQIGQMHGKQNSNYDKNKPILTIYGYDENGSLLQTIDIDEFTTKKENQYIKSYIYNAEDIAYLEVLAIQLPYESGKSYNFAFKGIDLIAWPYE